MSDQFALLQSRLEPYGLRMKGDRGTCACPVCGGKSKSTLSIGISDKGNVLIRCWKSQCSVEEITAAIGLEVADLFPPRDNYASPMKQRRMLSDRQALDIAYEETQFVGLVAANIAYGVEITDVDRIRCLQAAGRIAVLRDEARS